MSKKPKMTLYARQMIFSAMNQGGMSVVKMLRKKSRIVPKKKKVYSIGYVNGFNLTKHWKKQIYLIRMRKWLIVFSPLRINIEPQLSNCQVS